MRQELETMTGLMASIEAFERKQKKPPDIDGALELVISLAEQNTVDRYDNPAEYRRQMAALRLVKETFNRGDRL